MSSVISFVSGKGGVGKTSLCVLTGLSLSSQGKKTLIIETDSGLRGLDLILGVYDKTAFDLSDALRGNDEILAKSIIKCDFCSGLYAICAAASPDYHIRKESLRWAVNTLRREFDVILLDAPAGMGNEVDSVCAVSDKMVLVTTPDAVTVRGTSVLSSYYYDRGCKDQSLIINMVETSKRARNQINDFDTIIDTVGARLIGVVPFEKEIANVLKGDSIDRGAKRSKTVDHIAGRLSGQYIRLSVK